MKFNKLAGGRWEVTSGGFSYGVIWKDGKVWRNSQTTDVHHTRREASKALFQRDAGASKR